MTQTKVSSRVAEFSQRLASLDQRLERIEKLLLSISQAYYWSPAWQHKEQRADEEATLGRSKKFGSADELIAELNS